VGGQHAEDHHHHLPCARNRRDGRQELRGHAALLGGMRACCDGDQQFEELEAVLIE
jgi:hypothetical protein